jgi:hypothetical protein
MNHILNATHTCSILGNSTSAAHNLCRQFPAQSFSQPLQAGKSSHDIRLHIILTNAFNPWRARLPKHNRYHQSQNRQSQSGFSFQRFSIASCVQRNVGFPNFVFTSLCASHIHTLSAPRDSVAGGDLRM